MKLKVLIVQNSAIIGNKQATFSNVEELLEKYSDKNPDLIVFPEVWSIGWKCDLFRDEAENLEESETVAFLKNVAQNFKSTVIGGSFIRKDNDTYKNTCPVISKDGKLLALYDKMHLFSHKGSEENKYVTVGDELKILNIKGVKIGLSICYDIRFPELFRAYSKAGVKVFVNMAAWSSKKLEHWDIMHRARAIENQCFMITADQTGKISTNEYNLGHSMIINPWGDIISLLNSEEDCLFEEIDVAEVDRLRIDFPLISDRRDFDFQTFKYKEIFINE